ncbi:MAG: regulatory iron-sulfur-containing complex subunit RicT [bacterium]
MIYKLKIGEIEAVFATAPQNLSFDKDELVVVNARSGDEIGTILEIREKTDKKISAKIIRKLTPEDLDTYNKLLEENTKTNDLCKSKAIEFNLPIKVIETRIQFDNHTLHIYYVSEQKVNLKTFLKEVSNAYKGKIEVHPIGSRESVRQYNPYGICGRQVCCSKFLAEFTPIGTDLIELQNLSCGNTKLTGVCGRLICCLAYEKEYYKKEAIQKAQAEKKEQADKEEAEKQGIAPKETKETPVKKEGHR